MQDFAIQSSLRATMHALASALLKAGFLVTRYDAAGGLHVRNNKRWKRPAGLLDALGYS